MSMINRAACRKYALEVAYRRWHGLYGTRVGADFFDHLEAVVRKAIDDGVRSHPSVGKTLSMGGRKKRDPCPSK